MVVVTDVVSVFLAEASANQAGVQVLEDASYINNSEII